MNNFGLSDSELEYWDQNITITETNTVIEFFIEGRPVGKERPRVVSKGGHAFAFTPRKTKDYEKYISACALQARNAQRIFQPLEGAVTVKMQVTFANHVHPDLDNVIKAVLDGMNKIIYCDDKQVERLECTKRITPVHTPGVKVKVSSNAVIVCPDCNSSDIRIRAIHHKGGYRYVCRNNDCPRQTFIHKSI